MSTPLALKNLWHEKGRTLVAVAGVTFAVVLILMQLGFYGSAQATATLMYDRLRFDILINSPTYQYLSFPGQFPRRRLVQAAAVDGVERVSPMYVGTGPWATPESGSAPAILPSDDRARRSLEMYGVDPSYLPLDLDGLPREVPGLRNPGAVLMDSRSKKAFGSMTPGTVTEINRQRVEIIDTYALGTGFGSDGAVIVGERTFQELTGRPLSLVSLGLIELKPGADVNAVAAALRASLPYDVQVRTREEAIGDEMTHWVDKTALGIIFFWGAFIAFFVGTAIVYQVLAADISYRVAEYATLKAIGYSDWYLSSIVLTQSIVLGIAGFVPGFLISLGLYQVTRMLAGIPIAMTTPRAVLVLGLSVLMCAGSGLLVMRKLRSADPADLF